MRVVFVSQNELGLACLDELFELGADVRRVFTKPSGSDISDQVAFGPRCREAGVPLTETPSVNDSGVVETIRKCDPDMLFVIGWSELVGPEVLNTPSVTSLGMHPAPLPRGRGRAPVAWSLIKELDETALSFFHLVEAADAGDLVGQHPIPINETDDAETLYQKVVEAGRELLRTYYPRFADEEVPRTPQDDDKATWWPRRTPNHGLIDWRQTPTEVYNWIRGQTHPYPGAFSYLDGKRVTVWKAQPPMEERTMEPPGTIIDRRGDRLAVAVWEGVLELARISIDGGDERPAAALLDRWSHEPGERFENARDRLAD